MAYNPFEMSYRITGTETLEELARKVNSILKDLTFYVNQSQKYENATGLPINTQVTTNSPVWDLSSNINPDGTFPTSKLDEKMVGLTNELQLADAAVTEAKVAVGAITTLKLGDDAVTNMKIAVGEITEAKMNWKSHILY